MELYSLKMRASRKGQHVSGAEKILQAEELHEQTKALLQRALHHAKGRADFVNLKIEAIQPEALQVIDALPVSTISVASAEEGRKAILQILNTLGIHNDAAIMKLFRETYAMRGAMLLDADTLERLEPDRKRGIRATYMDAEHPLGRNASACKNHFQEAIVLASKVLHAPHIIAEICMSDDPDYVTGYVSTHARGYVRITKMKAMGCPDGGRIFLYRGPKEDVPVCIQYLQEQRVLVRHAPDMPDGTTEVQASPWDIYQKFLAQKKRDGLYRTTEQITTAQAAHVICHGQEMLLLASNDYLGLANHPVLQQAAIQAVKEFGTGSGGARLATGTLPLHDQLEADLAKFHHAEAALLFNTGYMANVGMLSALGIEGTVIFSDEKNHASIIDGCRLSHARTVVYKHNDMQDLRGKLERYAPCQGLIVTDAVFSMDGDMAQLPELLTLTQKYHLLLMVDEAHALGVLGATGHGIGEHFGLTHYPENFVGMGTLSKALGSEGGYAYGSHLLIHYLRNAARSYIFSTSLAPATVAAAKSALQLLTTKPAMVQRLRVNVAAFCEALQEHDLQAHSESAIVPIIVHDERRALQIAELLKMRGIFLSAIRYPTVARGEARLRAAVMATHTPEELRQAAKLIAEVVQEV